MKTQHFLYKSDGLYYMHNVPDKCYYYYRDERIQTEEFDHKSYNKALERAKAEAIKCDEVLREKAESKIPNGKCCVNSNVCQELDRCMREGEIYTINMEEKIEIYTEYINPCIPEKRCLKGKTPLSDREDWCKRNCELAGMERFARIAEPKEQEEQVSPWRDVYHQLSGMLKAGRNVSEIVESLSYKFEIKRKPL